MIILSQTYEIVTEESAAEGEIAESGFDWENSKFSFRELVEIIQGCGFIHPSEYPCYYPNAPRWISTEPVIDYRSGEWETKSLHCANDARSKRYWAKACLAAGITKRK